MTFFLTTGVLMQPENVEVSINDHLQKFSFKWNGSWPTATVFIVLTRKQMKGKQLDKDAWHDWEELIQVFSLFQLRKLIIDC